MSNAEKIRGVNGLPEMGPNDDERIWWWVISESLANFLHIPKIARLHRYALKMLRAAQRRSDKLSHFEDVNI